MRLTGRTLEFRDPDRAPRDLWLLPVAMLTNGEAAIAVFQERWPTDIPQCSKGRPKARRLAGDPYQTGLSPMLAPMRSSLEMPFPISCCGGGSQNGRRLG